MEAKMSASSIENGQLGVNQYEAPIDYTVPTVLDMAKACVPYLLGLMVAFKMLSENP
jgi:hypothetical protein